MRAEGQAHCGRKEGGREGEARRGGGGGSRAALTTRAPRLRRDGAGLSPPPGASPGGVGDAQGRHRAQRVPGRVGSGRAAPPRGEPGQGALSAPLPGGGFIDFLLAAPARRGGAVGPGRRPGAREDGAPGAARLCGERPARTGAGIAA